MTVRIDQPPLANVTVLAQGQAPGCREKQGCLQKLGSTVNKTWTFVREKGGLLWHVITALFFRCVSWISPRLADKLEALWGHVTVIYLRLTHALREDELQAEIQGLRSQNLEQDRRIHALVDQTEGLRVVNGRLTWERNEAGQDRDRVIAERQELILSRAPILNERDHLREENQELIQQRDESRNQNLQLTQERNAVAEQKRLLEVNHQNLLAELGGLRAQMGQVNEYRQLNQNLQRFHERYLQIVNQGNARGATQLALETLIPEYKAHRERLHGMLQIAIDRLPASDINRVPLNGILRLSQEEMDHVEKISQTLHLIGELRTPLAQYFASQQPAVE